MTVAQKSIIKYLKTQFTDAQYILEGIDLVTVYSSCGYKNTFTADVFCDIIDARTRKTVAVSDLPHDLLHISTDLPGSWEGSLNLA